MRGGAACAGRGADHLGIVFVGLVRGQHVVVGRHDAEVGLTLLAQHQFVGGGHGGIGVGRVGAAQAFAVRAGFVRLRQVRQIRCAACRTALFNALCDGGQCGVQHGHAFKGTATG